VRVAADLAWLYKPHVNLKEWAGSFWRGLGVDPSKPLLVVNVVNARNQQNDLKARLAGGLDQLSTKHNLQVAFFSNETRDRYDFSAAQSVARLMRKPTTIVPNLYFSPDEVLALLSYAAVGIGQRYHFLLECALADVVPIAIPRAEKMRVLAKELRLAVPGSTDSLESASLVASVESALSNRDQRLRDLRAATNQLRLRAKNNFAFLKQLSPYKGAIRFRCEDMNDGGAAIYAHPQPSPHTYFENTNT
jgi:polysaccharide pyruvyl transferase WcaK-like protein